MGPPDGWALNPQPTTNTIVLLHCFFKYTNIQIGYLGNSSEDKYRDLPEY